MFLTFKAFSKRKLSTRGGEEFEGEGFLFFVQCLDIGEAWKEAAVDQGQASSYETNYSQHYLVKKSLKLFHKYSSKTI